MDKSEDVFLKDQRWVSETEPELGLGKIVSVEKRCIVIAFPASGLERYYAIGSAPIRRVRYNVGDWIEYAAGKSFRVEKVEEKEGLMTYYGEGQRLCETDLPDQISLSSAKDRLLSGRMDPLRMFDLRKRVWQQYHMARKSPARGFCGGRISLLLHQFYIAEQVSKRPQARVLLSDETGLGKTIEACLIMQRLIVSRRVERVLILVPETMVHQWFVELLRKFHLSFKILDENYCQLSAKNSPSENPFMGIQMGLVSLKYLARHYKRAQQALAAPWDLIMVDEAHHLKQGSSTYQFIEMLAQKVKRVFLLTATPEQLGRRSHFARLKILDPIRYNDYDQYLKASDNYRATADLIEKIYAKKTLSDAETALLENMVPQVSLSNYPDLNSAQRNHILARCVDRYGPGRVMFRNTRRSVKGFAGRKAHLISLTLSKDKIYHIQHLANDFLAETGENQVRKDPDFSIDPRIDWLAELLKAKPDQKILLICTTPKKVRAIHSALCQRITVDAALFHEELNLLQRDRNAAWFADPAGARLLICSEIGSEGRNFQFASHLVLFDLPLDPEQLEQRIGRLDRIGQKTTVNIHVPYLIGSPQEAMVAWYHKGLNLFERHFYAGPQILERFGEKLRFLAANYWQAKETHRTQLNRLLDDTIQLRNDLEERLTQGRDRLLQYASFQPLRARHLVKAVLAADQDRRLEVLMERLFDHYGIETEQIADRTYKLSSGVRTNAMFPLALSNQVGATFDRETALKREDYLFLTWDHPLVTDAVEMLLNSSEGNFTAGNWSTSGPDSLILEAVFILEGICHKNLHADRFLPPTPLAVAVDQHGRPLPTNLYQALQNSRLEALAPQILKEYVRSGKDHILFMLKSCRKQAEARMPGLIKEALETMDRHLKPELLRYEELSLITSDASANEIRWYQDEIERLRQCLSSPTLRLDSLRLVVKTNE